MDDFVALPDDEFMKELVALAARECDFESLVAAMVNRMVLMDRVAESLARAAGDAFAELRLPSIRFGSEDLIAHIDGYMSQGVYGKAQELYSAIRFTDIARRTSDSQVREKVVEYCSHIARLFDSDPLVAFVCWVCAAELAS